MINAMSKIGYIIIGIALILLSCLYYFGLMVGIFAALKAIGNFIIHNPMIVELILIVIAAILFFTRKKR